MKIKHNNRTNPNKITSYFTRQQKKISPSKEGKVNTSETSEDLPGTSKSTQALIDDGKKKETIVPPKVVSGSKKPINSGDNEAERISGSKAIKRNKNTKLTFRGRQLRKAPTKRKENSSVNNDNNQKNQIDEMCSLDDSLQENDSVLNAMDEIIDTSQNFESEKPLRKSSIRGKDSSVVNISNQVNQAENNNQMNHTEMSPSNDHNSPRESDPLSDGMDEMNDTTQDFESERSLRKVSLRGKQNSFVNNSNQLNQTENNIQMNRTELSSTNDSPHESDNLSNEMDEMSDTSQDFEPEIFKTDHSIITVDCGLRKIKNGYDSDVSQNSAEMQISGGKSDNSMSKLNNRSRRNPPYCKICSKMFTSYRKLVAHRKEHVGDKPYNCMHCSQMYTCIDDLRAHLRLHQGKLPYKCRKCHIEFKTENEVRDHESLHVLKQTRHIEKQFECELCFKRFRKISEVERHMRVHTGEKPVVCNICNKRFQQTANLTKHLLIHIQEKPFECEICGKKFGRVDVLNRHFLTHSLVKPHNCSHCNKSFIRLTQLTAHLAKYHASS